MTTTQNARRVLDELIRHLDTEVIPRFIEKHLFARDADLPMRRWSTLNQLIAFCAGTADARGYRQWQEVGRHVVRGSRALYILVPIFVKIPEPQGTDERREPEAEEETKILSGFRSMPVFRVEDTEGEPLAYEQAMNAFDPSRFPLFDVAEELELTVETGLTETCYGWYSEKKKKIMLGTDDVTTFFHELSHAVDYHLPARRDDYAFGECVAELSSCFLCRLYHLAAHESRSKAYIESYQGTGHAAIELVHVIDRVIEIYEYIAAHTHAQPSAASTR